MQISGRKLAVGVAVLALASSTGGAVAGGAITGKDIKNGSITGKDVKNHSIGAKDLAASATAALTGPPGPAGPGAVRLDWSAGKADTRTLATVHGVSFVASCAVTATSATTKLDIVSDQSVTALGLISVRPTGGAATAVDFNYTGTPSAAALGENLVGVSASSPSFATTFAYTQPLLLSTGGTTLQLDLAAFAFSINGSGVGCGLQGTVTPTS